MDFCIFVVLVYIAFVLSIGLLDILHTLDDIQEQIDNCPRCLKSEIKDWIVYHEKEDSE